MRRITRMLLSGFGVRNIEEADDGASALELFEQSQPDLVITDWVMPVFDGLELTRAIRNPDTCSSPYTPIIMITGYSERSRVTVARDAGVTEFLAKPISGKDLYLRINNCIVNPRQFVRTKSFFGPDRRRFVYPNYAGELHRKADAPAIEERKQKIEEQDQPDEQSAG